MATIAYNRTNNNQLLNNILETNATKNETGFQKTRETGTIRIQPNTMDVTVYPLHRVFFQLDNSNNYRAILRRKMTNIKNIYLNKIVITGIVGGAGIYILKITSPGNRNTLRINTIHNLTQMSDEGIVLYHDGTGTINETFGDEVGQLLMSHKIPTDMNDVTTTLQTSVGANVTLTNVNLWFTIQTLNFQ